LDWARGLNDEVIQEIAAVAKLTEFDTRQVVIELDSDIDNVYFVVLGRLEGALFDRLGKEIHRDVFERGSVVGLFSVLLPDRSHLHVEALEHTTVITLGLDDLLRLTAKHREFQLAMFRVTANIVKHLVTVDREVALDGRTTPDQCPGCACVNDGPPQAGTCRPRLEDR
jgi:CRP-like cAMP-binding protein